MHDTTTPFPGENGTMTFDLGWERGFRMLTIHGGPFRRYLPSKGKNTYGLNLKAEEPGQGEDTYLPIRDYSTPTDEAAVNGAVCLLIFNMIQGKDVYVGCMGGWGRTGLILAILAKAMGEKDPVGFVRDHYTEHAVETKEQQLYVAAFDVYTLQMMTEEALLKGRWLRWIKHFLGIGKGA